MKGMISVIVLCYRRFDFIFSAIDSVLNQNYGKIELLISDDGSSNFPQEELEKYINDNKKANIVSVLFNRESTNVGTVKHLNHAISLTNGDYIVALAADDILFDEHVLKNYVAGFKKAGEDCLIEMAQTAMCDYTLENIEGYYLQPDIREVLEREYSNSELFSLLAYKPYLPSTSTCFKKEFFEKFGKFDEKYKLVEDVPTHLRLAREGWNLHYENFLAIKHRTGGISHGNMGGLSTSQYLYITDLYNIRKNEIIPYYSLIDKKLLNDVKNLVKKEQLWLLCQLKTSLHGRDNSFSYGISFWLFFLKLQLMNNYYKFARWASHFINCGIAMLLGLTALKTICNLQTQEINIIQWIPFLLLFVGICCKGIEVLGKVVAKIEQFPEQTLSVG